MGIGIRIGLTGRPVGGGGVRDVGLLQVSADRYEAWRHVRDNVWEQNVVARNASGVPLNWRELWLRKVLANKTARQSGVVYTGTWADTVNSLFNLSSASATTYVGGLAKQATVAGDYVEITATCGGDLFVIYTGRTSANYVNVLVDGAQDYVVLPDDGAGNRFFDAYSAVDLTHKLVVKIASGVPFGEHTIRLTVSASRNPSSAGNRFLFQSLSWDGQDVGPWLPETDAPVWASGVAVLANEERKSGANYYFAAGAGTTGATAPTHASGSVSDGGVTWTFKAASSFALATHRLAAEGSQLEYAYEIKPTGAASFEDVGGQMHGNEAQDSLVWSVDGTPVSLSNGQWAHGREVLSTEEITVTHSEVGGGLTPVVNTVLTRAFSGYGCTVAHEHEMLSAGEFGYFYPAMRPVLHYSSIGAKYGVLTISSANGGSFNCADFYGVVSPLEAESLDLSMSATGIAFQPDGVSGVPTGANPEYSVALSVSASQESVSFGSSDNEYFSFAAMNPAGIDVSSGGFSSMLSKIYIVRHITRLDPAPYSNSEVIRCSADYRLSLSPFS